MIFSARTTDRPGLQRRLDSESERSALAESLNVESLDRECRGNSLLPRDPSAAGPNVGRLFPGNDK